MQKQGILYSFLSFISWPLLLAGGLCISYVGFVQGHPFLYFNIAYVSLAIILLLLERVFPFESAWHPPDGQNWANILHTLGNKGTVQLLVMFGGMLGITSYITPLSEISDRLWPRNLPLYVQVIMVCVIADFMLYWAHRLSHTYDIIWRFHSIHHSVTKLWIINTGRFHFVDSLYKIVGVVTVLLLLGTPLEVVQWFLMITAYIGIMTHCNVAMRNRALSYVFNTPEVHRWHHSRNLSEGNNNYGENIVLWDILFGTYYHPRDRRPPANIGIDDTMPAHFFNQLLYPFYRKYYRLLDKEKKLITYP